MKLPFLNESKWPISKEPEERVVNPSYDKQIQDHLVDEMLKAMEAKDHKSFGSALCSLIDSIKDEERGQDAA